jgi:hypothetical protein
MGGRQSVLRPLRLSHHLHPAGGARKPRYFRNFYGAARCASGRSTCWCWWWSISTRRGSSVHHYSKPSKTAPWLAYIFFVQNLFHLRCRRPSAHLVAGHRGAVLLLWAPLVRFCAGRGCWLGPAPRWSLAADAHATLAWITPTHTLIHLDGIAWGSLLALGLAHAPAQPPRLALDGPGAMPLGFWATATIAGGTAFLDSALAVAFAGAVLAAIASTGARNPSTPCCAAARWPSMAASATAFT